MSQNNQQQQQQQQERLVVNPEELEVLQDLNTQLQEARDLHRQTTDPSDKEELSLVIEELEEQLTTSLNEVASSTLGVKPFDEGKWLKEQQQHQNANNNNNTKTNQIPSTSSTSSLIPAAHHLLRWEGDNKLYACNITRLFFEGNEIKCNVKIPGYPENNKKNNDLGDSISFSRQNIVSGNFDPATAFLTSSNTPTSTTTGTNVDHNNNNSTTTTTTAKLIEPGAKCFAVNVGAPSASDRIFIPCVVERLTMHSTVWVIPVPVPPTSSSSSTSAPAVVAPSSSGSSASFEVPISLVRPYSAPPSQGKLLRKKWENLTQEEKNQIIEEKKKKQQEQQEKQRRQRNETINNQANDWNKMRSLMGGSGGGRSIMGGARKF